MIIGAIGNMVRSFLSPFWYISWNIFFKNVTKSIKNSLKYIQLNHLWQTSFKSSKISIKKLFIHKIKHIPKSKRTGYKPFMIPFDV